MTNNKLGIRRKIVGTSTNKNVKINDIFSEVKLENSKGEFI